ncbi:MAG: glucose 1-dehydrogenase [Dongiaceae bacterium]
MSEAIRGRVVLVTGGASGIGRGIVEAFAAAGAQVALSYATSGAEAAALAARLGALALPADLAAPDGARDLVAAVRQRLGPVEILVANAGGLLKRTPVVECDLALWNQAIALNLTSVFLSCQAVLPDMLAAGRGCIITVSSLAGHDGGGPGASHYGAAKGGVITFTKALAKEVGPQGIRVNGIAPGLIATRFHDTFSTAEGRRATVERTPLRREGTPADVAGAALFLASDQAGFIAGETLEVNGGLGLF